MDLSVGVLFVVREELECGVESGNTGLGQEDCPSASGNPSLVGTAWTGRLERAGHNNGQHSGVSRRVPDLRQSRLSSQEVANPLAPCEADFDGSSANSIKSLCLSEVMTLVLIRIFGFPPAIPRYPALRFAEYFPKSSFSALPTHLSTLLHHPSSPPPSSPFHQQYNNPPHSRTGHRWHHRRRQAPRQACERGGAEF